MILDSFDSSSRKKGNKKGEQQKNSHFHSEIFHFSCKEFSQKRNFFLPFTFAHLTLHLTPHPLLSSTSFNFSSSFVVLSTLCAGEKWHRHWHTQQTHHHQHYFVWKNEMMYRKSEWWQIKKKEKMWKGPRSWDCESRIYELKNCKLKITKKLMSTENLSISSIFLRIRTLTIN